MMLKYSNLDKPKNKAWKFISKFLTRTLPVYVGIIAVIPDATLNADAKVWIGVVCSAIVATISSLSEFTSESAVKPVEDPVVEPGVVVEGTTQV